MQTKLKLSHHVMPSVRICVCIIDDVNDIGMETIKKMVIENLTIDRLSVLLLHLMST